MTLSGFIYQASAGETFDSIAMEVYGDEKYAAELLCVNVELCEKLVFSGGEEILLPEIEIVADENTGQLISAAPWKE